MAHFGLICPPGPSHVTASTTIARELCGRGHRATAFNIPDVEELATKEGVEFHALGATDHPKGSFKEFSEKFGRLRGMKARRFGLKVALDEVAMLLNEAPDAMHAAGVTALFVDQGQPAGSTIAERLAVPFVTICNAVSDDPDPAVPPAMVGWGPATSWTGRLRNRTAWWMFDLAATPIRRRIDAFRRTWNLTPLRSLYRTCSPVLEISQQTKDFDFPRRARLEQLHYVGLIRRRTSDVGFPFERLDGRPVVYATLGTVAHDFADLPGTPIVVRYAPQAAVLERAAVTVCHAGNNTVLESLAAGVPVVAVPLNTNQFGVAARLVRSGAGDRLELKGLRPDALRERLRRVLSEPSFRERARAMRESIERAGGAPRAADLVEQTLGLRRS
jgi:UDP:flavonoid glycosyltransferase YjiC (YdhE family)